MRRIVISLLWLLMLMNITQIDTSIITTLNKNDPAPIFSSAFPYSYLYQHEKEYLKKRTDFWDNQFFNISISPFYQRASVGTNIDQRFSELGDLTGKWNMIAVLPQGNFDRDLNQFIPTGGGILPAESVNFESSASIANNLFCCINKNFVSTGTDGLPVNNPIPEELLSTQGLLSLQTFPEEFFGFFSVPIKYRKIGVRFDSSIRFNCDFGLSFQTGVADISQTARFIDQTTTPTQCIPTPCISDCPTTTNPAINCLNPFAPCRVSGGTWKCIVDCVHTELMNKLGTLAEDADINLCNFNKTSMEDVHLELWWRHAFNVNPEYVDGCWTPFYFIPFASIGGSFATGAKAIPNQPLSLAFGNNGHNAVRFNAGFTLDFVDTIELGMHAGVTHFFKRNIKNLRVPNNDWQNGFIPFKAHAQVQPGDTWHVGLVMNAYRFLGCFSSNIEYLYVSHLRDKICLWQADPNNFFKPCNLECKSPWNAHLLNVAINLDVSPNFTLGLIMQLPLARRNAYKTSTYMASFLITY